MILLHMNATRAVGRSFVVTLLLLTTGLVLADETVLESISLHPQGNLLRIDLRTGARLSGYTLLRQGTPQKRDLLVRIPGFVTNTASSIDTGDYVMPIDVAIAEEEDGGRALEVRFGYVGDALVSMTHDDSRLTILVIPPPTLSDQTAAYRIGPNDTLQIDVFGHEDLNKTLKVSPAGLINFPLIGNVLVANRTVDEIAEEITTRLEDRFLREPHVTVSVWEYLSQFVNVIGEVAQPGRYYMTGPTTLIDALSEAGGLTESAGSEILVSRQPDQLDPSSVGEVYRVRIAELFSSEGGALNLPLRSGDIINVLGSDSDNSEGAENR